MAEEEEKALSLFCVLCIVPKIDRFKPDDSVKINMYDENKKQTFCVTFGNGFSVKVA